MTRSMSWCLVSITACLSGAAAGQGLESVFRGSEDHSRRIVSAAAEPFVGIHAAQRVVG